MRERTKVWGFFAAIAALGIGDGFIETLWPDAYYRLHYYAFEIGLLLFIGYWAAVFLSGLCRKG